MMTREDRQEALSLAYVHAVAAACGMTYSVPSKDYGIDLTLHEIAEEYGRFSETGLRLEIQAKCTAAAVQTLSTVGYNLDIRAYNNLRATTCEPQPASRESWPSW